MDDPQSVAVCDAKFDGLSQRVESHADDISILYKRTERPTWLQMWIISGLTGALGFESAYILMSLIK